LAASLCPHIGLAICDRVVSIKTRPKQCFQHIPFNERERYAAAHFTSLVGWPIGDRFFEIASAIVAGNFGQRSVVTDCIHHHAVLRNSGFLARSK
jgi:hypothetical protein